MPSISVDGGQVCYDLYVTSDKNSKPWMFIFPGMAMPASAYKDLATLLLDRFNVIVPNHRGISASDAALPLILTVRKVHEDTLAIMATHGIKRCHVLGESYGGMLAMSLAEYFPALVESVYVINSSLAGSRHFRLNPQALALGAKKKLQGRDMWPIVAEAIFSIPYQSLQPTVFAKWVKVHGTCPFPTKAVVSQTVAAGLYFGLRLPKLDCPIFIIYGELDHFVDTANSKKIHKKVPSSKLIMLPGVGHHACGESPAEIAKIVRANSA
jgi:aminoacrylate hydrolase